DLPQPPSKEIFVFTPSGELRILPAGASVLDFAFNIHSNIGIRCTGGKINGKAVSIKEKLKTGDVVEIMTGKNQKPSADWVNFVVSSKARGKIRQVLHEAEFQKASEGKELLERRLKNWKLELPDDMLREFMKKFHYPTLKELYSAIGDGTLDINDIKTFILDADKEAVEEEEQTKAAAKTPWSNANEGNGDDLMIINAKGVKGIDYKMAKCCNPVFGDDVFGFVTRDSGIKIHRISCPNAARLIEMYPYRIQRVKWADSPSSGSFQATVRVISYMESYVVNEIMDIINNFKSSLRSFNVIENQKSGNYDITMKISVPSNTELDKVISQIRNLKSVQKVSRQ
ncbi:MAG: bifunctional (p)ppGpp synthetase/guanosine-3',5'-bis(diphosphate) 3'-pyrophosphohydrolase, partial [Bacteroidales bacterium]|nr:bifunctional (p)ppGpp synthetase/guanosine-3',5'-bis(diphosphate) 3'-pyrophosphohydrolase [Bacteroidales bacterium]